MGVLPVNNPAPSGGAVPPSSAEIPGRLNPVLEDEYLSGLDDVESYHQERERERRERMFSGPAMDAALRFSAGIGGGLGLDL